MRSYYLISLLLFMCQAKSMNPTNKRKSPYTLDKQPDKRPCTLKEISERARLLEQSLPSLPAMPHHKASAQKHIVISLPNPSIKLKTYQCAHCEVYSFWQAYLKKHQLFHDPSIKDELHECSEPGCHAAFIKRSELNQHRKEIKHKNIKKICTACNTLLTILQANKHCCNQTSSIEMIEH